MQTQRNHNRVDDDRTSVSVEALKRSIMNHLFYLRGTLPETATAYDYYIALVYTVRDRLLASWLATGQTYQQQPVKRVVYLAPHGVRAAALETHLINLGIDDAVSQALKAFGLEFNELLQQSIAHPEEPGQLATQHLDVRDSRDRLRDSSCSARGRIACSRSPCRDSGTIALPQQPLGNFSPRTGSRGERGRTYRSPCG
jgi:hypothetical protein